MFFEYARPVAKAPGKSPKRAVPTRALLAESMRAPGQGRRASYKVLRKRLGHLEGLPRPLQSKDQRQLWDLVLSDDPRIWKAALPLAQSTTQSDLSQALSRGQLRQGPYLTLLQRLGRLSSKECPMLFEQLSHPSEEARDQARRLLLSLDRQELIGHCVLALRSDQYDSLPLIDLLAELGPEACFARPALEQRLESWGCDLAEAAALEHALSRIPTHDPAEPCALSAQREAA